MNPAIKILAICDSPTRTTGFAEVARQLLGRFVRRGATVHIWGIGFDGTGYQEFPSFHIFPADSPYHLKLGGALQRLAQGGYTHVWLLNDLNFWSATDFPAKLRHVCALNKVRSLLYFPVDARLESDWCAILPRVDVAVAYTQFGVAEVRRAGCQTPLQVLPHGVDTERFSPGTEESGVSGLKSKVTATVPAPGLETLDSRRKTILKEIVMRPTAHSERLFATAEDFLILNVNKNEWRKDPFTTLRIVAELKWLGVPAKLLLRMDPHSGMAGISLESAGEQLGLELDLDWTHLPEIAPEHLPSLYQAADLYLTTTLGEGWGLGITEALACGCPVALPYHGVMKEIADQITPEGSGRFVRLYASEPVFGPIDSRLRMRVEAQQAARMIQNFYGSEVWKERPALAPEAQEWLNWDRIAGEMYRLITNSQSPIAK